MTESHHFARSWAVLMVKDGPGVIGNDVRLALEKATYKMKLDRWPATKFKGPTCQGFVEDTGQSHSIGACRGVLFKAVVSDETGEYKVNFLINENDLENGAKRLEEIEGGEPERGLFHAADTRSLPKPIYEFLEMGTGTVH